jgi:hypothetical protein
MTRPRIVLFILPYSHLALSFDIVRPSLSYLIKMGPKDENCTHRGDLPKRTYEKHIIIPKYRYSGVDKNGGKIRVTISPRAHTSILP